MEIFQAGLNGNTVRAGIFQGRLLIIAEAHLIML